MNNLEEHILLNNMGMNFKNQYKIDKAIELFSKALNLHEDVFTWVNLGHAYTLKKDMNNAIACYKSAIKLKPSCR